MHIHHLPLAFFTMTMLASQVEYLTFLINWALSNSSTSPLIAFHCSFPIFLFFYGTSLACGQIANLWHMMPWWIPGISDGCHANKLHFFVGLQLCAYTRGWWGPCWAEYTVQVWVHLSCNLTSSSIGFGPLWTVSSCGSTSKYILLISRNCFVDGQGPYQRFFIHTHDLTATTRCGMRYA